MFRTCGYCQEAAKSQALFKAKCTELEAGINILPDGRAKSLALTALEECYMWIGKAIRDIQLARNRCAPLQEERKDG